MRTIELPGGDHAVLALHGLLGNPLEMLFVGKRLQRAGYTVHIPLIPGYGYASGQDMSYDTTRYERWFEEVQQRFDLLKRTHASVSVVGLCIGAVLALRLASERPDDVAALSVLATTLAYDGWSIPFYRFLLPLAYYTPVRYLYSYKERFPFGIKNPKLQKWIAREMEVTTSSAAGASRLSAEGIFQADRLIKHVKKDLGKVRCPTLIIHAEEDDVATPKSADLVERSIASAITKKIILHDSYHIITLDNEKERVATETVTFFDQSVRPAHHAIPTIPRDQHEYA
ncbi:alpha/beta fold hydrolase [Actimicrobium sp. CCC2.4]|uniref:alpha/beta hydrolase n=1 Tax=Actimicrobium sp. CCC2.4 TaxID=3048606 RepID=UPI002AC8C088|nr:alpha/beta fold hydrolase [Actimicrobium sp. CCC2.4]MEB0135995.1 alpha/beta fold hydrolase [Actimicrobium sp. CCC2.4]WPX32658.1 alpha/beta fold hydrolase [Actimicrobium sp. CCC2.4]